MLRWQPIVCLALLLAIMFLVGCSRQPDVPALSHITGDRQLPFDRIPSTSGVTPSSKFEPKQIFPGIPIVIRLRLSLSSQQARLGDSFDAVLADPILVEQRMIAPAGSSVTGKVIAAKAAGPDGPGYLRITLSTIVIDGASISVQTSSLFSKGRLPENFDSTSADAKFSTSRRLTFRFQQFGSNPETPSLQRASSLNSST
jgi:hypothetical protein